MKKQDYDAAVEGLRKRLNTVIMDLRTLEEMKRKNETPVSVQTDKRCKDCAYHENKIIRRRKFVGGLFVYDDEIHGICYVHPEKKRREGCDKACILFTEKRT